MNKRGLSQLIIQVLLILLIVGAMGGVGLMISNLVAKDRFNESQARLNCLQDVDIELLNVCYYGNLLHMKVKNKRELILGDFFLVEISFENGSSLQVPTPYNTFLEGYETKDITMIYYQGTKDVLVIPKIEDQSFLCFDKAPKFENVGECDET